MAHGAEMGGGSGAATPPPVALRRDKESREQWGAPAGAMKSSKFRVQSSSVAAGAAPR